MQEGIWTLARFTSPPKFDKRTSNESNKEAYSSRESLDPIARSKSSDKGITSRSRTSNESNEEAYFTLIIAH